MNGLSDAFRIIDLNGQWNISHCPVTEGTPEQAQAFPSFPCMVPGDVHNALVCAGEIGDPLVGENMKQSYQYETEEWWYQREVLLESKREGVRYALRFEGINIHGKVYLNSCFLGETENAFLPYEFDVTDCIHEGSNNLQVMVDCGLYTICNGKDIEKYDPKDPGAIREDLELRRIYLRKPQFEYNWDWARRLVTVGLWKPVELREYHTAALRDLHVTDVFEEKGFDSVTCNVEIEAELFSATPLRLEITLSGYGEAQCQFVSVGSDGKAAVSFVLQHPALWYPNGYGAQPLYTVTAKLYDEEAMICERSVRHGIRKIGLDDSFISEEEGHRFAITINDVAVFCKGANWVPADHILANVSDEKYRVLIRSAKEANYNMLRIWGGGIYETDCLYELCDEYGIMVWQDFIFANAYYPSDQPAFRKSVEQELESNIKRLRKHVSLTVWCGNNEIQWQHEILHVNMPIFYGQDIYEELIPKMLSRLDSARLYRPSSPYSYREPNNVGSAKDGDSHSWYIWLGQNLEETLDVDAFLRDNCKFASEYGVQSHPNYASIEEFLGGEASLESDAFRFHKNVQEENKIYEMLKRYYLEEPDTLDVRSLIHFSQYMQGETYRLSIEHFVRRSPNCMGIIYWMYNDCWGCTSWTCIDYYNRKKSSWYIVKRAYSPVLATMLCRDGKMDWYLVQTTASEMKNLRVHYGIADFSGKVLWENEKVVDALPASQSVFLDEFFTKQLPDSLTEADAYAFVSVKGEDGEELYHNTAFLTAYKNLHLPQAKVSVQYGLQDGAEVLRVRADRYAVNLFIEAENIEFYDNGFDLQPGEERVLRILHQDQKISSLRDAEITASILNGTVVFDK